MSKQYWADAITTNCVWLLQLKRIGYNKVSGCVCDLQYDEDGFPLGDQECRCSVEYWETEAVFLLRSEAFWAGHNRSYEYGKYEVDWRIYGVPLKGVAPEKLAVVGISQEFIDEDVKKF